MSIKDLELTKRSMKNIEACERAEHRREILRLLALGEQEIAAGKGHDLAEVLRKADKLLAECSAHERGIR